MLRKCDHSVYIPEDVAEVESPYCSYCNPPTPFKLGKNLRHDDELGIFTCPLCLSEEFDYRGEENYGCPRCGFDNDYIGVI